MPANDPAFLLNQVAANINAHHSKTSRDGPLPFRPPSFRCRSESSYSDPHQNHNHLPAAGANSDRIHHHFSKQSAGLAQTSSSPRLLAFVLPHTQQKNQDMQQKQGRLEGPRVDPASHEVAAGARSQQTVYKTNHETSSQAGGEMQRARMNIERLPHKRKGIFTPPDRNVLKHTGDMDDEWLASHKPHSQAGDCQKQTWTWNRCTEIEEENKQRGITRSTSCTIDEAPRKEIRSGDLRRVHTSCKGEKKYNVCGIEDLNPPATRRFTKADAPPSRRHMLENDRRDLLAFERDLRLRTRVTPQHNSVDMWGVLNWSTRRKWEPPLEGIECQESDLWSSRSGSYSTWQPLQSPQDSVLPSDSASNVLPSSQQMHVQTPCQISTPSTARRRSRSSPSLTMPLTARCGSAVRTSPGEEMFVQLDAVTNTESAVMSAPSPARQRSAVSRQSSVSRPGSVSRTRRSSEADAKPKWK